MEFLYLLSTSLWKKLSHFCYRCVHLFFGFDCDTKYAYQWLFNLGQFGYDRTLHWRHHVRAVFSNLKGLDFLLDRLFRPRSKKITKLRVIGLCEGNSPVTSSASLAFVIENHRWPVNSPHEGAVTPKMFPFDYVIMRGPAAAIVID